MSIKYLINIFIVTVGLLMLLIMYKYCQIIIFSKSEQPSLEMTGNEAAELRLLAKYWEQKISQLGPDVAYIEFVSSTENYQLGAHDQAHSFGEALYVTQGLNGLTTCDDSFEFGCYHSFFSAAISEYGLDVLSELSDVCRSSFTRDADVFPCQHGIGHGILFYLGYDRLDEALALCFKTTNSLHGGCVSGVFMEFNFRTIGSQSEYAVARDDNNNLHWPCDSVTKQFFAPCYFEQNQWWLQSVGLSAVDVQDLCSEIQSTEARIGCWQGMGHYSAALSEGDVSEIIASCQEIKMATGLKHCLESASWLLNSAMDSNDKAQMLCDTLKNNERNDCYLKLEQV